MTITKAQLETLMAQKGVSLQLLKNKQDVFIKEVHDDTLNDLNNFIHRLENICSGLEIIETEFLNKRTVTQDKYPRIYRLLSDLKDARITFKMKRENDA